jgi:hypothetical protein
LNSPKDDLAVSQPKPDIIYGHKMEAFTSTQRQQLRAINQKEWTANEDALIYPFFVIELKGQAGNLWVAENQCVGGAAACVNMVEKLNQSIVGLPTVSPVDTTVFGIAMNGSEARLFVSWKEDEKYYMQQIKALLVQEPEQYLLLRRFVRNVLEWGIVCRRAQIGDVLDALLGDAALATATTRPHRIRVRGGDDGPLRGGDDYCWCVMDTATSTGSVYSECIRVLTCRVLVYLAFCVLGLWLF